MTERRRVELTSPSFLIAIAGWITLAAGSYLATQRDDTKDLTRIVHSQGERIAALEALAKERGK